MDVVWLWIPLGLQVGAVGVVLVASVGPAFALLMLLSGSVSCSVEVSSPLSQNNGMPPKAQVDPCRPVRLVAGLQGCG